MIVLQRRILWRRRERTGTTMWIGQISASVGMSCHQPARTTRGCPGYIRSRARCTIGFDASVVRTNACDGSSKRSDVNKPRQQRSALAARQNSCRQAEACGRHQRDNGQICSGRREGRKYRAVNSGAAGSESNTLQTTAQAAGPAPAAPAAWPDVVPTVATVGTPEPGAVLADAGAESVGPKADQVPDGTESTARGGEPTINAGMAGSPTATLMLLILALGLVAAGVVTRVVVKIAAARRAAMMMDHPESGGVDDQWRPERRNGPEHRFVDEPQESELVPSRKHPKQAFSDSRD
jgi:hypothetical protein